MTDFHELFMVKINKMMEKKTGGGGVDSIGRLCNL